jgi:hypothetical protein
MYLHVVNNTRFAFYARAKKISFNSASSAISESGNYSEWTMMPQDLTGTADLSLASISVVHMQETKDIARRQHNAVNLTGSLFRGAQPPLLARIGAPAVVLLNSASTRAVSYVPHIASQVDGKIVVIVRTATSNRSVTFNSLPQPTLLTCFSGLSRLALK